MSYGHDYPNEFVKEITRKAVQQATREAVDGLTFFGVQGLLQNERVESWKEMAIFDHMQELLHRARITVTVTFEDD